MPPGLVQRRAQGKLIANGSVASTSTGLVANSETSASALVIQHHRVSTVATETSLYHQDYIYPYTSIPQNMSLSRYDCAYPLQTATSALVHHSAVGAQPYSVTPLDMQYSYASNGSIPMLTHSTTRPLSSSPYSSEAQITPQTSSQAYSALYQQGSSSFHSSLPQGTSPLQYRDGMSSVFHDQTGGDDVPYWQLGDIDRQSVSGGDASGVYYPNTYHQ